MIDGTLSTLLRRLVVALLLDNHHSSPHEWTSVGWVKLRQKLYT
jgi:hypothetical protein